MILIIQFYIKVFLKKKEPKQELAIALIGLTFFYRKEYNERM